MQPAAVLSVYLVLTSGVMAAEPYVPDALEPWVKWVLHDHSNYDCPRNFSNGAIGDCIWTRALNIEVASDRMSFGLTTTLFAEASVPLPGNDRYWPQTVRANDKEVPVTRAGGLPVVRLSAGVYDIKGSVTWQQRPDGLSVPRQFGLLSLTVDGEDVARPTINDGYLWFGERQDPDTVRGSDSLEVDVYRLLVDENPMLMHTYLELRVGGRSRMETLGRVLLPDFVVVDLKSELPARLGENGNLNVQVEAGEFVVEVYARAVGQPQELSMAVVTDNWPSQEIWAFDARRELRLADLSGPSGVDLKQVRAPFEGNLRGFLLNPEVKFLIRTEQRGDPNPVPNDYSLRRDLWLNFDGSGLIVRDQLDATITQATRLSASYSLGRITVNGENELVTRIESGEPGIELQNGQYNIESVSRIPSRGDLNAVGWNVDAQSLQATLHLPPGWRLLWADGVDSAPGSWLARWTLWDVFLITLALVLIWRFFSRGFAVLVGMTLIVAYQEAPEIGVAWLMVVGLIAAQRAVSHTRGQKLLRGTLVIALVSTALMAVNFAIDHARQSLHPQLERAAYRSAPPEGIALFGVAQMAETADALDDLVLNRSKRAMEEGFVTGSRVRRSVQIPESTQVQTGPGLPAWRWKSESLHWFGPVNGTQSMSLVLLPPAVVRVLNALMAVLVLAVTIGLGYAQYSSSFTWRPPRWLTSVVPAALIGLIAVLLPGKEIHAQVVDREILQDLQRRLLEPPPCIPTCASIERVTLQVNAEQLGATLRIHTGAFLAVPLPGRLEGWMPDSITRNGSGMPVTRDSRGGLQVALEAGVHDIVMQGPIGHLSRVELAFPLRPGRVEVTNRSNWQVKGLVDGRLPGGSLTLERAVQTLETDAQTLQQEPAPPYVRLFRTVFFHLEWRVQSRVERLAPQTGAMTVHIPLLAGESVLNRELTVEDGEVVVVFDPDDNFVSWTSIIPQTETVQFVAGDLSERTEVWELRPGTHWHLTHTGIVPSKAPDSSGPVFHPYSGETLTVTIERTQPIAGATVTVESVHLDLVPGERVRTSELELTLRASEGGDYPVSLPDGAVVSSVLVGGEIQPIPLNDGVVALPVIPGETAYRINWRKEVNGGLMFTSPRVDLASPANNITLTTQFPRDRWVLLLGGPDLGPAMLFWGLLIVVTLLGLALSRVPGLPLTAVDAVLLAMGLTLCNLPTTLLVASWFVVMLMRERWVDAMNRRLLKNTVQVITAAVSVLAVFGLVLSVPLALLGSPEMQITGYGSTGYSYRWFSDHAGVGLPTAWVFSLPLWIYRGAMLAWSLWLAFALLRWVKWAWQRWATPVGWFAK